MTSPSLPRLVLTPGEPAGIGPDLAIAIAGRSLPVEILVVADSDLLRERARQLGTALSVTVIDQGAAPEAQHQGNLRVLPVKLRTPAVAGKPDARNSSYILDCLKLATACCQNGRSDALVTGPVHKGIINDAGIAFSGHTEFLSEITGGAHPVMMLCSPSLRVALATTHVPLRDVPALLTPARLIDVIRILHHDLRVRFGISDPHIFVTGLNPHAGEGGHLGREELEIIVPALERLRSEGLRLTGPLPADTLFVPQHLEGADAVLAMYHDQGLPVLKSQGFGRIVNVTLGLPIIRTSVDHGTAFDLAGSGKADPTSLLCAVEMAIELAQKHVAGKIPA